MRKVVAHEFEAAYAGACGKRTSAVDVGGVVAPQQPEHAVERPQGDRAAVIDELVRKGLAAGAGARNARGEPLYLDRCVFGAIRVVGAPLAFVERNGMLANALMRRWVKDAQP
jgi:hypothetical protein